MGKAMETHPDQQLAEYPAEERAQLLAHARRSIEAVLNDTPFSAPAPNPHLFESRGAFTSLHLGASLRGCIGIIEPIHPLWQTVSETARAAAFEDPRFPPLTKDEFPKIQLEISVMSLLRPIAAEEVVVGRHGLVVSLGGRRGLLLPQVAPEWGWDREMFLSQTCIKAGLPPDAWKHGARLEAFTAEVFGED